MFNVDYVEQINVYEHGVDLVITEATYADEKRSCKKSDERDKDLQRIASAVDQYDKILFPSFAFARAQTVLTMLYDMYKDDKSFDHEIVLDSILLNDITEVYKKKFPKFREIMKWNKVRQIAKKDRDALATNQSKKLIVISASGSLVGGASVYWCQKFLPNPKACCVIVGHTFEGSLGRRIKDGKEDVIQIGDEYLKNNMQVISLRSMSSHIQYNELVEFLTKRVKTPKIAIHHSNHSDKLLFKQKLDETFRDMCKSVKVVCPDRKTKINL